MVLDLVRNDQLLWFMQILGLLPDYKGKEVIELGAGIGRFTGELAKKAGHVLAMDFMENLIKKVMVCGFISGFSLWMRVVL